MNEKDALRRRMLAIRASIPPARAAEQARSVAAAVAGWPAYRRARTVMLYVALPGELDTAALLDRTLADGKRLALPRCGSRNALDAVAAEAWRALPTGPFGLREPPADAPAIDPAGIDLVLAPGVAFDRMGHRLGYGRGFFDRFLAGVAAVTAGLAYEEQILRSVPARAHDVPLGYLITARGVTPALRADDRGEPGRYKGGEAR